MRLEHHLVGGYVRINLFLGFTVFLSMILKQEAVLLHDISKILFISCYDNMRVLLKLPLLGRIQIDRKEGGLSVINTMKHMLSGQITNLPLNNVNIAW